MKENMIYTIGYGNRKIEDFIKLLQEFDVQYLIDIRSKPYSKFNPDFNQNELKFFLKDKGIIYGFFGDTLGGRPECPCCYDDEGRVLYEEVKKQSFFKEGLSRVKAAYEKKLKIVLMCSESKPEECHRTKLVGEELVREGIQLGHIDENGRLKSQSEIMLKLTKGRGVVDLFGNIESFTSRKQYLNDK
ncbi:MAG TPA: DUF488 domain-containing protein [Phaeodactylibacter sp.]|nr:DUF488 domain-containing protein [Phaeodactylibacter sp.]